MYDLKINELILSSVTGVPGLSPAWVWGKYISGGKAQIWQGYDRLTQSRGTSDGVQTSEDIFVALCTSQKAFQAIRNNWNFPIEIFPPFLGKYCNISIFQKGICENTPFAKPRIYTQIFVISPQNSDPSPRILEMPTLLRDTLSSLFCWKRKRNTNENTLGIWWRSWKQE